MYFFHIYSNYANRGAKITTTTTTTLAILAAKKYEKAVEVLNFLRYTCIVGLKSIWENGTNTLKLEWRIDNEKCLDERIFLWDWTEGIVRNSI